MDDHPAPLKALSRMKLISLGKQMDSLKRNVNSSESGTTFLLAECLKKAQLLSNEEKEDNELEIFTDTSVSSTEGHSTQGEHDGIEYISGYIAKTLKQKYSWLGKYSYQLDRQSQAPSWVMALSKGGLMVPSEKWLEICRKMNTIFEKYHSEYKLKNQIAVVGKSESRERESILALQNKMWEEQIEEQKHATHHQNHPETVRFRIRRGTGSSR